MAKKQANSGYTPSYKQPIARFLTLFALLLKEAFREEERVGGEAGKKLKTYNKGDFKGQSGNKGKLAP